MGRELIYDIMFGAFAAFIMCLILAAFAEMRKTCHYLNQESIEITKCYKELHVRDAIKNLDLSDPDINEYISKELKKLYEQDQPKSWCESEGLQSGGATQWEKVENNRED